MSNDNFSDFIATPELFEIFGRLNPTYSNGGWNYGEELFKTTYGKHYEEYVETTLRLYLTENDKLAYAIYVNGEVAGRILLQSSWNGYCKIEDLYVKKQFKRHGLGRKLVMKSIEWCKERQLAGVSCETQDINLVACRFYKKMRFEIGGIDQFLYDRHNCEISKEVAVFWYYLIDNEE